MNDILAEKKEIRRKVKQLKMNLSEEQRHKAEDLIIAQLLADEHISSSKVIAAYWSLPDEMPTHRLIEQLVSVGHDVYLPVIDGETLNFRKYEGADSLSEEKRFGIPEPHYGSLMPTDVTFPIIVPGIAFTSDGCRLGRGGGFYDHFLEQKSDSYKIGIAFYCQIFSNLPTDVFDIRMDKVIWG